MRSLLTVMFIMTFGFQSGIQGQTLNFSQSRTIDGYGGVIADWHSEQNTFVFNANGTEDILWITKGGNTITFSFRKKTTGYSADGYYYEEYEVATWNPEFEDEEIVVIRKYSEDGLLVLTFWDGQQGFLP